MDVWEDAVSGTRGLRDLRNARCSESTGIVCSLIINWKPGEARGGCHVCWFNLDAGVGNLEPKLGTGLLLEGL